MSTIVDERVVEMRFDNSNFERNIQGTLSTLDKFKQKLHLDGAAKGLETVGKAAKGVDMSNLGRGIETVQAKFSALEVMGVTALANLTNSAVNAGKRIAASLTIEPIKTGFNEYELKMNSVQTIMASTGESLETVNKYLEDLNKYSDQTIYSFSDMTQNIGKFTNAGVKLEDAVLAIKGISNEAAISGANANEASRAMYNFAQALSAGYVKLIDWKSIENANMATVEFKNQLIQSAVAAGTLTKRADGLYETLDGTVISATQNFNDSLKDQWMTTEVLVNTLRDYADENTEIGKKASRAATEVKTFSMMLDTLKESAQSGWAKTWEIIFGDFYEGKALWTSMTDAIGGIIDKMSDFRNAVLESALGRSFTTLSEKIHGALNPISKTADSVKEVVDSVKNYSEVVDQIISGKWGNGEKRWNDLAEAGYDWAHAQNLVNEKLGSSVKHATKYTEATEDLTNSQKESTKTQTKLTDAETKRLAKLVKMSDSTLKALGYEEDQIKVLRELRDEAEKTGYSVEYFVENLNNITGRTMLIDSFKNIGNSLITIFDSIKDAWVEIFEITPDGVAQTLYDMIAGFHKLTSYLVVNEETADNMKRTFKGLFAILDIVSTVVAGPLKIAFKVLSKLLGMFDMDIWDLTAKIGDAAVAFRDWLDSILDFNGIFEKIEPALTKCIDGIQNWISGLKTKLGNIAPDIIEGLANGIKNGASKVWDAIVNIGKTIINGIKNILGIHSPSTVMEEIGENTIQGYTNGLAEGVKSITDVIINIFRTLGAFFPKLAIFNQIAWIITTMKSAGGEITSNFGEGISNGISNVTDAIKDVFMSIKNAFGNFDWSKLSAGLWVVSSFIPKMAILNIGAAISGLMAVVGNNAADGLKEGISSGASGIFDTLSNLVHNIVEFVKNLLGIHSPSKVFFTIGKFLVAGLILGIVGAKTGLFDAAKNVFGKVIEWIKNAFTSFRDWLSTVDFPEIKMENILGIGLLVGVALFAKKLLDIATTLSKGVQAFGNGIEAFGSVAKKISGRLDPIKKGKWDSIADNALKLSAAIAILAGSAYLLAQLDYGKLWSAVGAIVVLGGVVIALGAIINKIDLKGQEFGKFSLMLVAMSASLWIMASAIKKLSFLNADNIGYVLGGTAAMILGLAGILAVMGTLIKGNIALNIDKAGITIFKIATALSIMAFAIKQISKLDESALSKGIETITIFTVIVAGLIASTKLAGNNIDSVGPTILKISLAIGIMAIAVKLLGKMDTGALIKGSAAIVAFSGIIVGLIAATKLAAGNDVQKIGGTIAAVSAAIMMLGVTAAILSMISVGGLAKGIIAVTALGGIIVGLIAATKLATKEQMKGVASTLFAMSLAIGIMGATAVVLSMISIPGLIKGVTAVTILGSIVALMIHATKGATECNKSIVAMAIAIGVMAAAITVLSFIDPTKLAGATIALGIVMGMFALMTKAAGTVQKAMGTIIVMTLAVGALAGLIYLLAGLPIEQTIGSAIALGGLVTALSVSLRVLSAVCKYGKKAIIGVGVLTAMVVPLAAFIAALYFMPEIDNLVETTNALINLMLGMTVVLGLLTIIGLGGPAAIIGVGSLWTLVVPLQAFINVLATMPKIDNLTETVDALTAMLIKFSLVLGILTIIGLGGPAAIIGVGSLLALVAALGVMITAAGGLMKIAGFEEFMNGGIELLKRLAQGMGEIITAFGKGLTSGLPEIGENLSKFMDNLSGFISGANLITDDLGNKITTLANAIVLLTAADLIAGISSFLQNGSSFSKLGIELSTFMTNAASFIAGIGMINAESLAGVKSLAEAILVLTASKVLDGLTSWFTGGASLADFGAELAAFGPHMATYAKAVAGIDGAAVESSAKAAKSLAEMASALPNSGGMVSWFSGENDMSTFGTQLVAFGTALKSYSTAVTGIVLEPIMASVEAGKALAEMADIIPNLGGVVSWFTGDNGLAAFGAQLLSFGWALKSYSFVVTGIALESIMNSVEAGKALAGLNEAIPNLGGMVTWFTGDNDLTTFGTKIISFGWALKSYSATVTGLNVAAITVSVTAATQLAKLANALPSDGGFWSLFKDDKIDFADFSKEIKKLGEGLVGYSNAVSTINAGAVSSSISSANRLISLIKNMDGITTDSVSTFSAAIGTLGKTSVDKFVNAFTSSTSKLNNIGASMLKSVATGAKSAIDNLNNIANNAVKTMISSFTSRQKDFQNVGTKLMNSFVSAINKSKSKVKSIAKAIAATGVTAIRSEYKKFYKAGTYVVSGFVKGINDNKYKATKAGTALGNAAYKAAKAAIDSNSPSKKFLELGMFADQGLANGLLEYAYLATRASAGLGRAIVDSMQEVLGIHSPSKVIKDEVGNYIVEGLAEGITENMSAEEAAEKKASNIINAFKDELSKHDLDMNTANLEYELWESKNQSASDAEKTAQKIEAVNSRIISQTEKVSLAQGEYNVTLKEFGANAEETQKAYNKLLEEKIALETENTELAKLQAEYLEQQADSAEQINKSRLEYFDKEKDRHSSDMETTDLEYELWLSKNPTASDAEKRDKKLEYLESRRSSQNEKAYNAQQKYLSAIKRLGEDSEEVDAAYKEMLTEQIILNNIKSEISDLQTNAAEKEANAAETEADAAERRADEAERQAEAAEREKAAALEHFDKEKDKHSTNIDIADNTYELWESQNPLASDAEKTAKKIEAINSRIVSQNEKAYLAQQKYLTAIDKYGDKSPEAMEAYNEMLEEQIALNKENAELINLQKESKLEYFDKEKDKHTSDIDVTDLEYDLWLKRNKTATATEKLAKETETINSRVASQNEITYLAHQKYLTAVTEYGEDSVEAQEAYNVWLEEQIKLEEETGKLLETRKKDIQNSMDAVDAEIDTYDLIHELWASQNQSASLAEKTAHKAASIYSRIASQTEKVSLAQASYKLAVEEYGEGSIEAQKAYNGWLNEQIVLNNESVKLLTLRNEAIEGAAKAADLDMSRTDLEKELWETENSKASDAEKSSKNLDSILEKLPEQAEKVGLAQATWESAKEQYGKDSNEAKEAYNEYLQAQIDMATLTSEAGEAYTTALNKNRAAQNAYFQILRDNTDDFLKMGYSSEEIQAWAREQSGYDPDTLRRLMGLDVDKSARDAKNLITTTYDKYSSMTYEDLKGLGIEAGEGYEEGVNEGVNSSVPEGAKSAAETVAETLLGDLPACYSSWTDIGKTFVEKFADGISNAVDTVKKATITMVSAAYQTVVDFINDPANSGFTATITPVLDLSRFQNGIGTMNGMFATSTAALADINVRLTNDSIAELRNVAEETRKANEASHSEIITAIKGIRGDVNSLAGAIEGMQVTLDGNAVVGELLSKIDNGLGQIVTHKGRGN